MTRVRDVIKQARTTVSNNLQDPNIRRRNNSGTWVFDHFPKYEGNTKPRIGFYTGAIGHPQQGLGGVNTYDMGDMNAGVFVDRKNSYDFNDDGENEPAEDLLAYLINEVKTIIEQNQSDFTFLGNDVNYVKPVDTSQPVRPENQNWIFMQTVYEVRID